ncbi:hypothetical protein PMAYCL1PPCAC_21026, partial [Pristionchus mayeri]
QNLVKMNECAEGEEAPTYAVLSPMAHHSDEHEEDGVDEHSDVGPESSQASDGFTEVNAMSPPRETIDDEIPCSNCTNYRDNTLKAFEAASNLAKLQAQHQDLITKYQNLVKNNASASMHVEEGYKKLRDTEVQRDSLQGDLSLAVSEVERLQEQNKQFLEAARLTDKHRQAADDWRGKYVQSQAILLEKSQKYGDLEEKYRKAVDMVKASVASSNENAKKAISLQEKLSVKNNENKALKKHWNVVSKLVADISRQCADDLPIALSQRLNKLPIDDLLQIAKPHVGGVDDSDDEDAEAVQRLMDDSLNLGNSLAVNSPPKSRGAAKGRGNRGGRGHTHSLGFTRGGGEKDVVDESMHVNMLARKLRRDDIESMPTVPSDSVAKSVMGKKTETVREQQERLKAGFKNSIAELKKVQNSKDGDAKEIGNASTSNSSVGPSTLEEDMVMSDDDGNDEAIDENNDDVNIGFDQPSAAPIEYDIDMPEIFDDAAPVGGEIEDSSTSTSQLSQSVSHPSNEAASIDPVTASTELNGEENTLSTMAPSTVKTAGVIGVPSPAKLSSPSKMIQHPKVAQLSQGKGDSDSPREFNSSKRDVIQELGMNLSDSDENDDEGEEDNSNEEKESALSTIKNPLASPLKSPQKSPTTEISKHSVEKNITCFSTHSASNALPGLSTRINRAVPVDTTFMRLSTTPSKTMAPTVVPSASHASTSTTPANSTGLMDEILSGAHQKGAEKRPLVSKKDMPSRVGIPSEVKMPIVEKEDEGKTLVMEQLGECSSMEEEGRTKRLLASTKKTMEEGDNGQDFNSIPNSRSKSPVEDEMQDIDAEHDLSITAVPKASLKCVPRTPAEPVPKTPSKIAPKTTAKTVHKSPGKTVSKTPEKTSLNVSKTPSKKRVEPVQQELGLSEDSSDEEEKEMKKELNDEVYAPRVTRSASRASSTASLSSNRPSRSIVSTAIASRRSSTLPNVEAVLRMDPPGTRKIGAAKDAAARMREEAIMDSATSAKRPIERRKKVSAPSSLDDATPFSRNSKRTAVAAPRKSAAATTVTQPALIDEDVEEAAIAATKDVDSSEDPNHEMDADGDARDVSAEVASLLKKRVARMGSNSDGEISFAAPISSTGTKIDDASTTSLPEEQSEKANDDDDDSGEMMIDESAEETPPNDTMLESIEAKEADSSLKILPTLYATETLLETDKHEEERCSEESTRKEVMNEGEIGAIAADETLVNPPEGIDEHAREADEMEPGSCIVEGEEESKDEMPPEKVAGEAFDSPTMDNDNEFGDLVIDSCPNSPAATTRAISPMFPSEADQELHTVSNECSVAPGRVRPQRPKIAPVKRAPVVSSRTDAIPSAASKITAASSAASLEEKRKAIVAGISSVSSIGRGGARTRGRGGGRQVASANAVRISAATSGASRTSAMESQMAKMSKNLRSGKPVLSGTVRQRQPAASKATDPPHSLKQPVRGTARMAGLASARNVEPSKAKPISDPRPQKRKSSAMHAVEAMAIRAPEPRAKGKPANVPSTSSVAEPSSLESRLIATVLEVCKEEQTVERAMQHIPTITTAMTVKTIVKCICKALMELPQSNTWNVVRANISKNVEHLDRNRFVPKAERHLFALLMEMQEKDNLKLSGLFDCFYDEYCRHVLSAMSTSNTTADVTRNVRCLFFALVASDRTTGEKVDNARKLFYQILAKKSSPAVCQSLVYLLSHAQTASLASEILKTELDDDDFGGRFISMHMNAKDANVLIWAVDRFADPSCKTLETAAFRKPATLDMVNGWWKSDVEYLEKAKGCQGSVCMGENGLLEFDSLNKALIARMSALLSPEFRIDGLDRVNLLSQLDSPAINEMDKLIPMEATETMRDSALFGDTSLTASISRVLAASDARIICLKIHTAIAALNSLYADRMYGADQREALRLHLSCSIEKVHSILSRLTCDTTVKQSPLSEEDNHLSLGITAMKNWMKLIQHLTKKDLMSIPSSSSSESSPVKKRARREEYSIDPSNNPRRLLRVP